MLLLLPFAANPGENVRRTTNATKYYYEGDVCYFWAAMFESSMSWRSGSDIVELIALLFCVFQCSTVELWPAVCPPVLWGRGRWWGRWRRSGSPGWTWWRWQAKQEPVRSTEFSEDQSGFKVLLRSQTGSSVWRWTDYFIKTVEEWRRFIPHLITWLV